MNVRKDSCLDTWKEAHIKCVLFSPSIHTMWAFLKTEPSKCLPKWLNLCKRGNITFQKHWPIIVSLSELGLYTRVFLGILDKKSRQVCRKLTVYLTRKTRIGKQYNIITIIIKVLSSHYYYLKFLQYPLSLGEFPITKMAIKTVSLCHPNVNLIPV